MKIGNREFDTENNVYIMGILNMTPDSFSDGGRYNTVDAALFRAEEMAEDGASILDVGGQSTRPGYDEVSVSEEIERIAPIIRAIKDRIDIPISLDTYRWEVAREGIKSGADLINDVWGILGEQREFFENNYNTDYDDINVADDTEDHLRASKFTENNTIRVSQMASLVSKEKIPCVIMHNLAVRSGTEYLMQDVTAGLKLSLSVAKKCGIEKDKIILDPGIGFCKDTQQNLYLMSHLDELTELGFPVLLGASRKSVIGNVLKLPSDERLEGTLALTTCGVMKGCSFIRVHDVKENTRNARMALALRNA